MESKGRAYPWKQRWADVSVESKRGYLFSVGTAAEGERGVDERHSTVHGDNGVKSKRLIQTILEILHRLESRVSWLPLRTHMLQNLFPKTSVNLRIMRKFLK
jgi:hypothetical protein